MAGSLLVVLGLIVCLFYVLKKIRFGPTAAAGLARMRLLSTLSLAPKRTVALVEVRDQWLVVGVGTNAVTLLTSMPRPEDTDRPDTARSDRKTSFRSLLRSASHEPPTEER